MWRQILSLPFFLTVWFHLQNLLCQPFLLSYENSQRLSQRSWGSSGDQRQRRSCFSSGKPDDPLQSDNVNNYLATSGTVGVWNNTWRILLQDKCKNCQQCKLYLFYFFYLQKQAFARALIKANQLYGMGKCCDMLALKLFGKYETIFILHDNW